MSKGGIAIFFWVITSGDWPWEVAGMLSPPVIVSWLTNSFTWMLL